ncbi:Hpt domain-containing protein [Psychrobacter pygoscelis]|uniref:Hpt domain-containing protein n=1 Tax=Psychrobacter pygoscelis TaxID=2488563 RepID=UPI00103C405B|nr:Hpt domain-containing protein [Psychrobacter pygoscelis]
MSQSSTDNTDRSLIDSEQFEEMRDLLDDEFDDLVQAYILDSQARLTTLRSALLNNDNATGYDAAHTLKGASANLGATQLAQLCHQLQEACREQQISAQAALLDSIENTLYLVQQEINQRLGHQ